MDNAQRLLWMRASVALIRAAAADMKREAHKRDAEASPLVGQPRNRSKE
jgi:hypothetical protein